MHMGFTVHSSSFKEASTDIPETHHLLKLKFNLILKELASEMREEKNMWGIQITKEEIKLSLFADVIVCIKNPNCYPKSQDKR